MNIKKEDVLQALVIAVEDETGIASVSKEYLVRGRCVVASILQNAHYRLGLSGSGNYRYYSDEPVSLERLTEEFEYE